MLVSSTSIHAILRAPNQYSSNALRADTGSGPSVCARVSAKHHQSQAPTSAGAYALESSPVAARSCSSPEVGHWVGVSERRKRSHELERLLADSCRDNAPDPDGHLRCGCLCCTKADEPILEMCSIPDWLYSVSQLRSASSGRRPERLKSWKRSSILSSSSNPKLYNDTIRSAVGVAASQVGILAACGFANTLQNSPLPSMWQQAFEEILAAIL